MTREQRIDHYMMSNRRNLAELMVHKEDEYEETLKTQHDLMVSGEKRGVDKATEDFESRVCENCKHRKEMLYCNILWTDAGEVEHLWVEKDFGCLKFERKDK